MPRTGALLRHSIVLLGGVGFEPLALVVFGRRGPWVHSKGDFEQLIPGWSTCRPFLGEGASAIKAWGRPRCTLRTFALVLRHGRVGRRLRLLSPGSPMPGIKGLLSPGSRIPPFSQKEVRRLLSRLRAPLVGLSLVVTCTYDKVIRVCRKKSGRK